MIKREGLPVRAVKIILILLFICAGFFCFEKNCWAIDHIVISEIQITGGTGKTKQDFIEFYNPTGASINLKGHRLVKRTKTGNKDTAIKSWTSDTLISSHGYYLWANSADGFADSIGADVSTSQTIANDNGIALRFGKADEGEIIDSVGWGNCENIFVEGTAFSTNPGANKSIERKLNIDTDNNAADFEIQNFPNPQNSGGEFEPEPQEPYCGDGNLDEGEECDDGNNEDGDGCSADCKIEQEEIPPDEQEDDEEQEQEEDEDVDEAPSKIIITNKLGDIVINEFVSDPADEDVEWIELYNTTNKEVILDGWTIKEGSGAKTTLEGAIGSNGESNFLLLKNQKAI